MKTAGFVPIVGVLVLIISLACVWFSPSVQDFMAANQMWNGISRFSRDYHATNVDSLAPSQMPDSGTLVAVPYLSYSVTDLEAIRAFVEKGGTLLLMDDFGYGNTVLEYLGIPERFSHQPLLDPLFCYKNPALPLITDFTPAIPGVKEVLMNHASTLVSVPEEAVVARSSSSSFLDLNGNSVYDEGEPKGPFAVAAKVKVGDGIVALVSDPSTAINSMVSRFDNRAFIDALSANAAGGPFVFDTSHLAKAPLDVSKTKLTNLRNWFANPYIVVVLTAIVFALAGTAMYKGGIFE